MTGTVRNIVVAKAFGFISSEGKEYFFHKDDFTGHWVDLVNDYQASRDAVPVEFDVVKSPKGPRAANVRRTDHPNQAG